MEFAAGPLGVVFRQYLLGRPDCARVWYNSCYGRKLSPKQRSYAPFGLYDAAHDAGDALGCGIDR
eukprot:scaffold382_cov380-Prasinococcus_capsulatus_cf.AAC.4